MIRKKIVIKNILADYAFSGDPNKEWHCEVVDSNLNANGNPVVKSVRQGYITLECTPRQLNAELDVIFHTMDEKEAVAQAEKEAVVASVIPESVTNFSFYMIKSLRFILNYLRYGFKWIFRFAIISIVLGGVIWFIPTDDGTIVRKGLETWERVNVARSAMTIKEKANEKIESFKEPLWESEGIKELQARNGLDYDDLFTSVDGNLFIMDRPVLSKEDGNPKLLEQDDADDYCQEIGGFLPGIDTLKLVVMDKKKMGVKRYNDYPEWSSTDKGFMSDDYAMLIKKGRNTPSDAYEEDGQIWGDDGDIEAAFRCGLLREHFIE